MRRCLCLRWFSWLALSAMAEPVKVASIEGVTEYQLANGARVAALSRSSRGRR